MYDKSNPVVRYAFGPPHAERVTVCLHFSMPTRDKQVTSTNKRQAREKPKKTATVINQQHVQRRYTNKKGPLLGMKGCMWGNEGTKGVGRVGQER